MTNNVEKTLRGAADLIRTHGHTTFSRCVRSSGADGYCVGKAIIDAAGEDFAAWAETRRLFLTTNGVKENEYHELADEAAVGWNERAFAAGIDVLPYFDRAIAALHGEPLPDLPLISPYEPCSVCGARLESDEVEGKVHFMCEVLE